MHPPLQGASTAERYQHEIRGQRLERPPHYDPDRICELGTEYHRVAAMGRAGRIVLRQPALFTLGKILIEFYPQCVPSRACADQSLCHVAVNEMRDTGPDRLCREWSKSRKATWEAR